MFALFSLIWLFYGTCDETPSSPRRVCGASVSTTCRLIRHARAKFIQSQVITMPELWSIIPVYRFVCIHCIICRTCMKGLLCIYGIFGTILLVTHIFMNNINLKNTGWILVYENDKDILRNYLLIHTILLSNRIHRYQYNK